MALLSGGGIYMAPLVLYMLTADDPVGSPEADKKANTLGNIVIGLLVTFFTCWAIVGLMYYFR